jgi:16S rRNA processing protein RimM
MAFFMEKRNLYELGEFSKLHGFQGKLILSFDDQKISLSKLKVIWVILDGIPTPFSITSIQKLKKNKRIVSLLNVDSLNTSSLIKQKVYVSKDEISFDQMDVKLKYVGFSVWDENENEIGIVQDYADIKNNNLLIIEIDKQEVMIPVNETLIIKVLEKEKIIQLYITEGLLNLNSESENS